MNSHIVVNIAPQPIISYPILVNLGLLPVLDWLDEKPSKIVIISDKTVANLYSHAWQKMFENAGIGSLVLTFVPGEQSKNITIKNQLEAKMFEANCDRKTLIVALGGGVTGDLAGFIAATFMRGINYIQIPTSLLAMVDSSVGGKTGIDNSFGKNLIGAFWQPKVVVADLNCLQTLPPMHFVNGLIEIVKIFITHDCINFEYFERNIAKILINDVNYLQPCIVEAIKLKAGVVSRDALENGERALLNFGHTIGHAIELASNYQLLHGFAVGLGILVEAKIAQLLALISHENYLRITNLLAKLGINGQDLKKYEIEKIIANTSLDKKNKQGHVHYVLINAIGSCQINMQQFTFAVEEHIVKQAFIAVSEE